VKVTTCRRHIFLTVNALLCCISYYTANIWPVCRLQHASLGSSLVPVTTLVVVNTVVQPFVGWREGLTVNEEAKLQVQTVMKADIVVTCSDLTVKLDEHVSMCQKTNNNMTVAIHSATVLLGKYRVLPSSLSL
jgi:hypothetical protein